MKLSDRASAAWQQLAPREKIMVGAAAARGVTLADVEISRPDLESVFLHLTGKGLRD